MVAASFRRAREHPDCGPDIQLFGSNKNIASHNLRTQFTDTEIIGNQIEKAENTICQTANDCFDLKDDVELPEDFIDKTGYETNGEKIDYEVDEEKILFQKDKTDKFNSELLCGICFYNACNLLDLHKHHCFKSGRLINIQETHGNNQHSINNYVYKDIYSSNGCHYNKKVCLKPNPLKCEIHSCNFTTKFKAALRSHMIKEHTGEKIIKCDLCSYRCHMKKELKKHMVTHDAATPYVCDFLNCKYACKLSSNLRKHKRIHTQERPYACDQCPFRSNFTSSLKTHKRTHTGERPFCCDQCGYRCNSSSNLKKHMLQRHDKAPSQNVL